MYYAGYRVLPEAPLREDWVQVINAIFNRTRIMVIRMIIIMAIQIIIMEIRIIIMEIQIIIMAIRITTMEITILQITQVTYKYKNYLHFLNYMIT